MNCPPEIQIALLAILRDGILAARIAGWNDDSRRCAVEADHIHNLPALLADFSCELLQFYYDIERPAYIAECPAGETPMFEPHWETLAEFLNHQPAS